ncbi:MAG: SapC family protein [Sphingomonadaceae bacterium]|nr:SapC family protein [Sphingomonadaceae bacterium]
MATAPADLPLFYNQLEPLSSLTHGDWKLREIDTPTLFAKAHAVPITVDEFPLAQRHFPIIFSVGPNPVPLALMGLNEGINVFVNDEGKLDGGIYVPAYVRRYPYMLARLRPDADELSLCFDPTAEGIGPDGDGPALFEDGQPSEATKNMLAFLEQFEQAGRRTAQFIQEMTDAKLLIDGEVTIQPEGAAQPFIYRGFQMISEDAVKELRGDVARKMVQSGAMGLIYAHFFSLPLIRELFARQMAQGRMPAPQFANV